MEDFEYETTILANRILNECYGNPSGMGLLALTFAIEQIIRFAGENRSERQDLVDGLVSQLTESLLNEGDQTPVTFFLN